MHSIILLTIFLQTFIQTQTTDLNWWKTAVFYQIYPRSFKDSNNDGIGDIRGIIEKVHYLSDLGVTAIWLSPIYKSPQVDHGYDISDFRDVDPLFGNLSDLKELFSKCHAEGIKVILDFVPNHTSNKHDWFIKSENGISGYENYYVWRNGSSDGKPPNNWISNFHGSAWEYSDKRKQYYLHEFAIGQPDLNFREPKVIQEMKDVLVYWLRLGVDGFRMDIVPALFEHADFPDEPLSGNPNATPNDHGYLDHIYTYDQPETYAMVGQWRTLLDNYQAENGGDARVMMIETYSPDEKALAYYGNGTQILSHFPFNFWFITKLSRNSNAKTIKSVVDKWLEYTDSYNYTANWVLGNHDQHRVATRYGIDRIDGLAMLTLMLPGVGVIYNGEEISMENGEVTWDQGEDPQACNGLQEDFDKNSRDFERTPFQWDDTVNAGFNNGSKTWLPVGSKYKEVNLKKQLVNNLRSHYTIYQAIIKARKNDTVKYGKMQLLALNDNVLALTRTYTDNPVFLVLVNVGSKLENVNLTMIGHLPEQLSVEIRSLNSKRNIGAIVLKKGVTLEKYEALLATGTQNNGTNNITTETNAVPTSCINFIIMITLLYMTIINI